MTLIYVLQGVNILIGNKDQEEVQCCSVDYSPFLVSFHFLLRSVKHCLFSEPKSGIVHISVANLTNPVIIFFVLLKQAY